MTAFAFAPTATAPFQFQPILDGDVYTGIVTWNVYGRRWYLNLYALNGTRVLTIPAVQSPDNYDISLTAGYFTSKMVFRASSNSFEVTP